MIPPDASSITTQLRPSSYRLKNSSTLRKADWALMR